jgi:hypothetical protein
MKGQITSKKTSPHVIICTGRDMVSQFPHNSSTILQGEEACGFLRRICYREEPAGGGETGPNLPDALVCVDSRLLKKSFNKSRAFPWYATLQVLSLRLSTVVFSEEPPDTEEVTALVNSSAEGWISSSELPGYLNEIISAVI